MTSRTAFKTFLFTFLALNVFFPNVLAGTKWKGEAFSYRDSRELWGAALKMSAHGGLAFLNSSPVYRYRKPALQYAKSVSPSKHRAIPGLLPPKPTSGVIPFKAEVQRVLDIIVNSLYTDREIFLRELVSNSNDACDKHKILLANATADGDVAKPPLYYSGGAGIRIFANKTTRVLTIEDDGVGMSRDDLVANLGTIALSGTCKFAEQLQQQQKQHAAGLSSPSGGSDLIGQFGVGFYSAFLVADRVEVTSTSNGNEAWRWSSDLSDGFKVNPVSLSEFRDGIFVRRRQVMRDVGSAIAASLESTNSSGSHVFTPPRVDAVFDETAAQSALFSGTSVSLHVKDEADDFLEDFRLQELLKKYSEFVPVPVYLLTERVEYERVPDSSPEAAAEGRPYKTQSKISHVWKALNTQAPIWRKEENALSEKDYVDFYKTTFKAYEEPLAYMHISVEGMYSFRSLLFIPGTLPFELSRNMFDEDSRGIRLYVKRVFINDKFRDAIPRWLTFIRGVIDSNDLPLNVGREILQQSDALKLIHARISAKAVELLKAIFQRGGEKWDKLWENYGKYLKVGAVEDKDNQEALALMCKFNSTGSSYQTSLKAYIDRMEERSRLVQNGSYIIPGGTARPPDAVQQQDASNAPKAAESPVEQGAVYYLSGDSRASAVSNPLLEVFRRQGIEVLLAVDPLDEFLLAALAAKGVAGKQVVDVAKAGFNLEQQEQQHQGTKLQQKSAEDQQLAARSIEPSRFDTQKIELGGLLEWLTQHLSPRVHSVCLSRRLISSPSILVQGEFGLSPTLQRYLKQQASAHAASDDAIFGASLSQPVLELNPDHPVVINLDRLVKANAASERAKEVANLLFEVAALQGGYQVHGVGKFAESVIGLMEKEARRALEGQ